MASEAQGQVEGKYLVQHFWRVPRMAGFKVLNASYLHRNMGAIPQLSSSASRD